jgi:hypothetical protein
MGRKRTPPPEIIAKETEVVKLRRGGLTWDSIAERMGYAYPAAAHAAYKRAAARVVHEDVEAIRAIETDRLDVIQSAVWGKALSGEINAVQTVLKIMERRSKLLGLDSPIKQQVEVTTYDGDTIDREVARLIDLLNSSPQGALDKPISESGSSSV